MKATERENEETVSWPKLRSTLRVQRPTIDYVKGHAVFPRHGKPSVISDAERGKVFTITDEIIRRYMEYLIRGKKDFPEDEFPMLDI